MAKTRIGRTLKRLLKIFFLSSLVTTGFLLLILGGALALWLNPQWVVHEKNLKYIKPLVVSYGVSWSETGVKLRASSEAFYKKSVVLSADKLCVEFQDLETHPCVKGLNVNLNFDLSGWTLHLVTVKDFSLELLPYTYVSAHVEPETEKPAPSEPFFKRFFFGWKG